MFYHWISKNQHMEPGPITKGWIHFERCTKRVGDIYVESYYRV